MTTEAETRAMRPPAWGAEVAPGASPPTPWSRRSGPRAWDEINVCRFTSPSLWLLVTEAKARRADSGCPGQAGRVAW